MTSTSSSCSTTTSSSSSNSTSSSSSGCLPKSCLDYGYNCGQTIDSCGGTISCGTCPNTQTCGGGGTQGVCGGFICSVDTDCSTNIKCQSAICNNGKCGTIPVADGIYCNDNNACTQSDTCQNGICLGTDLIVCVALNQCHTAGKCDTVTGTCSNPIETNGSICNDGNACTQTDVCEAGSCVGSNPVTCSVSNECQIGVCDPQTGCVINFVPAGSTTANQTSGNCMINECDGIGNIINVIDDSNVPVTNNQCIPGTCSNGVPNWGNPIHDCWSPISMVGAPTARSQHMAVWTGTKMIVWGGLVNGNPANTGGVYDPVSNTWSQTFPLSESNVLPCGRWGSQAFWFDHRMVIIGGYVDSGGNTCPGYTGPVIAYGALTYDPSSMIWGQISSPANTPVGPNGASVNTGNQVIWWSTSYWGNSWRFTSASTSPNGISMSGWSEAPTNASVIWDGSEMIVYGGDGEFKYNPSTDSWSSMANEPPPNYPYRSQHVGVWTGLKMIVWGGFNTSITTNPPIGSGDAYDPMNDTWTAISTQNEPIGRINASAIWTGSQMIVWGGQTQVGGLPIVNGGSYYPQTDTWKSVSTLGEPSPRILYSIIWTGQSMIIWGGNPGAGMGDVGNGAIYYP